MEELSTTLRYNRNNFKFHINQKKQLYVILKAHEFHRVMTYSVTFSLIRFIVYKHQSYLYI